MLERWSVEPTEKARRRRLARDRKMHRRRWLSRNRYWLGMLGVFALGGLVTLGLAKLSPRHDDREAKNGPGTQSNDVQAALAKYLEGEPELAVRTMQRLSERKRATDDDQNSGSDQHSIPDQNSFLPDLWLAEYIVGTRSHLSSRNGPLLLRRHLATVAPHDLDARVAAGVVEVAAGNSADGMRYLADAATQRKDVRLPLAMMHAELGNVDEARKQIAARLPALQAVYHDDRDDLGSALRMVECLLLLGDFDQARQAIDGLTEPDRPQIRDAIDRARERIALADFGYERSIAGDPRQQLDVLRRAIKRLPDRVALWNWLIDLGERHKQHLGKEVAELIRKEFDREKSSAAVHRAIAERSLRRGRLTAAVKYARLAKQVRPDSPDVAHLLAKCMLHAHTESGRDPDSSLPDQAFQLVDPLVDANPDRPDFAATRAIALVAIGRFRDAYPLLNAASLQFPTDRWVHENLANCLEALGQGGAAERTRRYAREKCSDPLADEELQLPLVAASHSQSVPDSTAAGAEQSDPPSASPIELDRMRRYFRTIYRNWTVDPAGTWQELTDRDREGRLGQERLDSQLLKILYGTD